MSSMHLNAVESGVMGRVDRLAEIVGHLTYLVLPHSAHRRIGIEVYARRSTDRNLAGGRIMRHVSAVAYLYGRCCSFGMHCICYVFEGRNYLGSQPQLLVERKTAAANGCVGKSRHTHSATGHAYVIVFELLGGTEILAHAFECGRTYGTVAKRHAAQTVGGEELRILFRVVFFHDGVYLDNNLVLN